MWQKSVISIASKMVGRSRVWFSGSPALSLDGTLG